MSVSAFPLSWPAGRARTPAAERKEPKFRTVARGTLSVPVRLTDARERLAEQLDLLRARYVVLSTNMELRVDGAPRSGQAEPSDVGVALYFRLGERQVVLACDRWNTVAGNIAAIAAHIEALRGQERWGVGTTEQAFAGFASLPAPPVPGDWRAELDNPATLAEAEQRYRRKMAKAHPDAGGSHAAAATLNAAIERARQELKA